MLRRAENAFERLIFWSRWLQAPLYAGLIIAQLAYTWKFAIELWHLLLKLGDQNNGKLFLSGVLELIDFVMVANLIVMVVIGGYVTFVSKLELDDHADRPDWLEHIDPGTIKVKLAASLIGISSIQLLQSFVTLNIDPNPLQRTSPDIYEQIKWQIILHFAFLVSALMLALTEFVMHRRHRPGATPHQLATEGA